MKTLTLIFTLISATAFSQVMIPPPPPVPANYGKENPFFERPEGVQRIVSLDSLNMIKVTDEELSVFISKDSKYSTEKGKKSASEILLNAKRGVYFGFYKTYDSAVIKAEIAWHRRHQVDRVVIIKHLRKMYLQKDGKTLKTFNVALGPNPLGQKEYEGDGKTPEGVYTLDWTKWESSTGGSYHISYPNEADLLRAKKKGLTAGSNIMIHGTSKGKKKKDWTNGCIALATIDMEVFKQMVYQDVTVEILK